MTILKGEGASTLSVVQGVREALPSIQAQLPPEMKLDLLFDQSVFVEAAVEGVLKEGAIAAGLTALMILLFLGSWRSTLVVVVSIPLSILASFTVLWGLGLVQPVIRELRETDYQRDRPYLLDDSAARAVFGLEPTPWSELLAGMVAAYRADSLAA